ncbi:sugar-binding transcriptional regulator [Clostridiales bacterium COT073_COT-073]|nr:sugar-binding transcriptional regulator [Clostridiales bacterium COT073_COT-073]
MNNIDIYSQSNFLMIKIAYLYYIMDMPQSVIAKEFNISITTVSRLLKKGREKKIIEFVIRDPFVKCLKLEKEIKAKFGLKDVVIAPVIKEGIISLETHEENTKKRVALEAARYLQRIIKEDDVLGITWGSTVYQMINYLNPAQCVPASFVTLHGSLSYYMSEWDVRNLVRRIAKAFNGKNYSLPTNAMVSSKKLADMLKEEKDIKKVFEMYDKINVSVSGIGSLYPEFNSILSRHDYLNPDDLDELVKENVVGDIALHFFDRNGRECKTDLIDRTISIDFEKLKNIDMKITVASGEKKAYTVYSALKGKLIDVLIIDNVLASKILDISEEEFISG